LESGGGISRSHGDGINAVLIGRDRNWLGEINSEKRTSRTVGSSGVGITLEGQIRREVQS
jgi:hypothetical protein